MNYNNFKKILKNLDFIESMGYTRIVEKTSSRR